MRVRHRMYGPCRLPGLCRGKPHNVHLHPRQSSLTKDNTPSSSASQVHSASCTSPHEDRRGRICHWCRGGCTRRSAEVVARVVLQLRALRLLKAPGRKIPHPLYSSSAICTAFSAAPLSSWSPATNSSMPRPSGWLASWRIRPTRQSSSPEAASGSGNWLAARSSTTWMPGAASRAAKACSSLTGSLWRGGRGRGEAVSVAAGASNQGKQGLVRQQR